MKFESQNKEDCEKCEINLNKKSSENHNHITATTIDKDISSQACISTQQHVNIFSKHINKKPNSIQIKYRRHKYLSIPQIYINKFNTYYLLIMFALVTTYLFLLLVFFFHFGLVCFFAVDINMYVKLHEIKYFSTST